LDFRTLLDLEDSGILNLGAQNIIYEWKAQEEEKLTGIIFYYDKVIVLEGKEKQQIQIDQMPLTKVGKEVLTLGTFEIDQDYLNLLINELKNQGCKVYEAKNLQRLDSGWKADKGREL